MNRQDRVERPLDSEGYSIYSLRSDGPPLANFTPQSKFGEEEPTQFENGPTLLDILSEGKDAEEPSKKQQLDGESLFSNSSSSASSSFFTKSTKIALKQIENLHLQPQRWDDVKKEQVQQDIDR